jgi:hypothetical protein
MVERLTDDEARQLAFDLRRRIEEGLNFQGTIKITVIRESRFNELAKYVVSYRHTQKCNSTPPKTPSGSAGQPGFSWYLSLRAFSTLSLKITPLRHS